jgi:segregation and condensation protein B
MQTEAAEILHEEFVPPDDGNGNGRPSGDGPAAGHDVDRLAALIESLLFAAGAPVTLGRLMEALDGPSRSEVAAGLERLVARCREGARGVEVVQVAGGYQLRTPVEHGAFVRRLLRQRPPRLSRAMLETVAIVAYRQPCTRVEVEAIRGVDCDAVINTLLERSLIRMVGRKDAPGRPILYATTREFLEVFGLPDLSALPPLRELVDDPAVLAAMGLADDAPPAPAPEPAAEGG